MKKFGFALNSALTIIHPFIDYISLYSFMLYALLDEPHNAEKPTRELFLVMVLF